MTKKIITVFKTHFDIGFTELAEELIKRYSGKMLKDIIHTCESTFGKKDKKFIWTFAAWVFLQTMKNASEEDRAAAERLIQNGQLKVHALPYTMHTEFLGLEELNRACNFALESNRDYGVEMPLAAKMTDVPGHTVILPSILANAGVKFLHLGVNPASKPVDLPMLFWWEGQDGSRVLTFYNKGAYGSSLMPPKDWKYPVWLALMQSNDNIGPQSPQIIDDLEQAVHASDPNAQMQVGTLDDFYREIIQYDLSDLPVIRTDFADTWIHGIGSYPKEVSMLRRNRSKINALQTLAALSSVKNIQKTVDDVYEQSLLFGEHTWGLDVKSTLGYARSYVKQDFLRERETYDSYKRIEKSWDEQRERANTAVQLTDQLYKTIRASVVKDDEKTISIFNPQACEKHCFVSVEGVLPQGCGLEENGTAIRCIQSDNQVYAELDMNPLEMKHLTIVPNRATSGCVRRETEGTLGLIGEQIAVDIDKQTGSLILFADSKTGKNYIHQNGYSYEVVESNRITEYIRDYSYRMFDWSANDFGRMSYPVNYPGAKFVPKLHSAEYSGDSIVCEYVNPAESLEEYGNAERVRVIYTILGNRLNIRLTLVNKQATPFIEDGNFVFDFNFTNPQYQINKVGSIINPKKDIAKNANNLLYCMENYVDITDGEKSLALISHDAPLFSIGENANYKFRGTYTEREDCKIFVNLFNNQWGTNFPQWTEGTFTYEFDLLPHTGTAEAVSDRVFEVVEKPVVFAGCAKEIASDALTVEGGQLVTAFESKNGLLVRIREDKKQSGIIRLSGTLAAKKIRKADSFGNPKEECSNEFETAPMQIHTLIIGE